MNKNNLNIIDIGTSKISYKIIGNGKIDIVVELGLGSCIAEWYQLAKEISKKGYTVLLYERAGTGYSTISSLQRTPVNIANELNKLLEKLDVSDKITILAHSQGGLYAQAFTRIYKKRVKKIILLDPLSANDNKFKELLTEEEFRKSGVDKFSSLKLQKRLANLHLGFIIKALMKNAPPFYYYEGFSKEEEDYILSTLTKANLYETSMEEYKLSHDENIIASLKEKNEFPDIPLVLITHSSEFCIKETMEFGGTTRQEAEKIEDIWQQIMKEYLNFSRESKYIQAKNSGHYIHLLKPNLILENL